MFKKEVPSLASVVEFLNQFLILVQICPYKDVFRKCNIHELENLGNWMNDISELCVSSVSLFSTSEAQIDILTAIWNMVSVVDESISHMNKTFDLLSYEDQFVQSEHSLIRTIVNHTEKQVNVKAEREKEYREKFESISRKGQEIIDIVSSIKEVSVIELRERIKPFVELTHDIAKLLPQELNMAVGLALSNFLNAIQVFVTSRGKVGRLRLLKVFSEVISNLAHPLIPLGI